MLGLHLPGTRASELLEGAGLELHIRRVADFERGEWVDVWNRHNPARGGLSWIGEGRGCNQLNGWFAIDHVAYTGGRLIAIDLRFEQRYDGDVKTLRGKVRWRE
jgi:hypothetical protein